MCCPVEGRASRRATTSDWSRAVVGGSGESVSRTSRSRCPVDPIGRSSPAARSGRARLAPFGDPWSPRLRMSTATSRSQWCRCLAKQADRLAFLGALPVDDQDPSSPHRRWRTPRNRLTCLPGPDEEIGSTRRYRGRPGDAPMASRILTRATIAVRADVVGADAALEHLAARESPAGHGRSFPTVNVIFIRRASRGNG